MLIGLDYDDTYTKDPEMWDELVDLMRDQGCTVYVVTRRFFDDPVEFSEDSPMDVRCDVVYCDQRPKRQVCEGLGLDVDIWIDDLPEGVGSEEIPFDLLTRTARGQHWYDNRGIV
jgi:hypothetical protein